MSSIHLNATRIEQLVEQLNGLNKRLMGLEGKLLRYALSCKIKREDFLEVYQKSELDPNWIENVSHKSDKHWKNFVENTVPRLPNCATMLPKWLRNVACRLPSIVKWSILSRKASAKRKEPKRK